MKKYLALLLALVSTAICLMLAFPLAMILKGSSLGRKGFIVFIFILPMWMNFLLRTMAWQVILEKGGIFETAMTFLHLPFLHIINTPAAIASGITMVFVPALTTFVISNILGGGKIYLIGNIIEQEFTTSANWNLGSGLSLIMMIFIIGSMMALNRLDKSGEGTFI